MKRRDYLRVPFVCALMLGSVPPAFGQESATPPATQDDTVRVTTSEVLLDAVVRDKKGRPVQDLSPDDFEVYEDGVRQQIRSVRLVKREANNTAAAAAESAPSTNVTPTTTPPARSPLTDSAGVSAIALVFDRLSPEARKFARDAALNYSGDGLQAGNFVGVFNIDLSLRVVQPYTTDTQLVREAISRSGSQSSSSHASNVEQIQNLSNQQQSLAAKVAAAQSGASGGGQGNSSSAQQASAAGAATADQMFAEMAQRSLEVFEMLERDQQGYATTNGLLAVVNSMRRLPGRKALIFFSEGLAIPPGVQAYFRSVINSANRANVSIYAVDAAGLRALSGNDMARNEISRMANQAINRGDDAQTGRPLTMGLERNEDLLRSNPQGGLGQLASETGGFLIADTNNLKGRLRLVDEDLRTYYLLTYTPQNQNYDGRFRQIEVKLKRQGLDVQSRKGYYAINAEGSAPVLAYEAPALAALGSRLRANSFPVYAAALNFPQTGKPGLVPVVVEVPARTMTYAASADKKTFNTDFTVVALIKDDKLQVVKKMSNRYQLTGALDKMDAAKNSEILFYRETELPPGRYTVEAAVHDALANTTSVRAGSVEVPDADETKLRLSSVAIVKRGEQLKAADKNPNNPFQIGEALFYPNLGEPLRKAATKQMAFFFTAYLPKGDTAAPKMLLEIMAGSRALAQLQADLPVPDAAGRVQYASALPLDKFPPGKYDLKITVRDAAGAAVSRSTAFTVEP